MNVKSSLLSERARDQTCWAKILNSLEFTNNSRTRPIMAKSPNKGLPSETAKKLRLTLFFV